MAKIGLTDSNQILYNLNMIGFVLNKLVRDRMPQKFRGRKIKYWLKPLTDAEFEENILKKVHEEADEFLTSTNEIDKAIEAADLLEAIDATCSFYGLDPQENHNFNEIVPTAAEDLHRLLTTFTSTPNAAHAKALVLGVYGIAHPISKKEIQERRDFKAEESGLFRNRVYMTEVDVPEGSPWLFRFQECPGKYPNCVFVGEGHDIDCF
jgi:predicted house-cleaning noncanonical NTP pyrophosphatase (MazG superfamily)